jgi:AMP-binding enzyme C-terminal domain
MLGLMQDRPLALPHVFHRAERYIAHKSIITATAAEERHATVGEWAQQVRRLATVLDTLEVSAAGRVATFCWIMAHPKVAEAAVIAIPHERWVERPLACVVVKPGEELTAAEVLEFLSPRVARWWLPDAVEFIDEVPKTSVGKFSKKTLREKFAGYRLPEPDG